MVRIFIDQIEDNLSQEEKIKLAQLNDEKFLGSIPGIANGWFTVKDAEVYKELVSPIKDGLIIEVGAFEGLSLYHIKDICKANNTKLIAVDLWKWDQLVKNTKEWGIEFINLPSIEASKLFPNEHFDLVFLDARHTSRTVEKDIAAWWPKVKKDGTLAGHDFNLKRVRRGVAYRLDILKVCSKFDAMNPRTSSSIWWREQPHQYVIRK